MYRLGIISIIKTKPRGTILTIFFFIILFNTPFLLFSAHTSEKITTIGIGDGGNEIGMGKVQPKVIEHIQNGRNIACAVATDYLVTAGVSNWGGSALVAALHVLNQCPVHSRYAGRGVGTESKEDVLNTVEMVIVLVKLSVPS